MATETEVEPLVYSVKQTAKALGLSPNAIYELIRSEQLRSVKFGRRRLVPKDAVLTYVATGGERS